MTDTSERLQKAKAALAQAEGRIAELKIEREDKLTAGDEVGAVKGIDREITEHEADAQIYRERIRALEEELRSQRHAERERERERQCDNQEALAAEWVDDVRETEKAIRHLGKCWFKQAASRRKVIEAWPKVKRPRPSWDTLSETRMAAEFSYELYAAGKPSAIGGTRLPNPAPVPAVAGLGAKGMAALAEQQASALLASLRAAPLLDDPEELPTKETAA
jgi:hypothetical protein